MKIRKRGGEIFVYDDSWIDLVPDEAERTGEFP
jgi:hypothetical protein